MAQKTYHSTIDDLEFDVILRTGYAGLGESEYVITSRLRGEYPYNTNPSNDQYESLEEAQKAFVTECAKRDQQDWVTFE